MEYSSIFKATELNHRVILAPYQLKPETSNETFEDRILLNLKKQYEGKNNDTGYIASINRIRPDYECGELDHSSNKGIVIYDITFDCMFCTIKQGDIIVSKITQLNITEMIKSINGPLVIIVQYDAIDTNKFRIQNDGKIQVIKTKKILQVDEYIKIVVIGHRLFKDDKIIVIAAKLVDVASEKDIKKYNKDKEIFNNKIIKNIDNDFI
jgi:DNA-directed RNA polymerase subunit E'/Rpb7